MTFSVSNQSTAADKWREKLLELSDIMSSELDRLIQEKKDEYDGLVSTDRGAIILVGRDNDIDLVSEVKGEVERGLDIENIVSGMQSVTLEAKVKKVFSVNEFDGGKVRNIVVYDDTGETQVSLWNEQTELADGLEKDDVIRVENGYTKREVSDYQKSRFDGIPSVNVGEDGSLEKID